MEEAEKLFYLNGSSPVLTYASDVSSVFSKHSAVDFSLERVAERLISVPDPAPIQAAVVSGRELLKAMIEYVRLLGVENHVIFRQTHHALALANVLKPGSGSSDRRLIVNYNPDATMPLSLVPGICAHELGTHLLRMLNDDLQVWRGAGRKTYRLAGHMATEEGLATLNTLVASNEHSLRHSALNYWAVCQGARLSFSDLYFRLEPFISDASKRFRLCVRVKRGLVHTENPGACTLDQNYFRGAVDILRNLECTDLRLLYCGQVARTDVERFKHLITVHGVRLPPFLDGEAEYQKHVRSLVRIRELNGVPAPSLVPRPLRSAGTLDDVK